ncbi:MAG: hypothetical protein RBG13Loki_0231 [Promethearchaeota archaeon CR_4]|nr:MAG: hypothetical protein RBG13Loki_0231 [Candidatus Lokiarchaeota archaeon CR_4]
MVSENFLIRETVRKVIQSPNKILGFFQFRAKILRNLGFTRESFEEHPFDSILEFPEENKFSYFLTVRAVHTKSLNAKIIRKSSGVDLLDALSGDLLRF